MTSAGSLLLRAARLHPSISLAGDLVVSFLVGSGATTVLAFWISLIRPSAGLPFALAAIAASLLVEIGLLSVQAIRAGPRFPSIGHLSVKSVSLAVLPAPILIYEAYVLLTSVIHSGPNWDGTFVWEIKARYFAALGGVPPGFFQDLSREWSHLGYPLLLPLTEALTYRAIDRSSQGADMVITATFVLGLLVLLYELIRRAQGPGLASVFALLLLTVPATWDNALQAFADLPLALFLVAGTWLVYRWFDQGRRISDLILGGVLLAFAIWVKREGFVIWGTTAAALVAWTAVIGVKHRSLVWQPVCAFVGPIVVVLPWLITLWRFGVPEQDYVGFSATWFLHHADRVPAVIQVLFAQFLLFPTWGIVWILIGAGALLRPPRSLGRGYLLGALAAHILSLTIVYTFSAWTPFMDQVKSSIERVVFQVLPLGLLLLATGIDPKWWTVLAWPGRQQQRFTATRSLEEPPLGWMRPGEPPA